MIAVSVSGAAAVARGLDTLTARLADLSPAFRALGPRMIRAAAPVAPYRSGELARSLVARATDEGLTFGSDLVYAGVQNYGWPRRNIRGHHFLEAGGDVAEDEGPNEVESLLTSTARRAGLT